MPGIKRQVTIKATAENIYELIATKNGIRKWLKKEDGWKITGQENPGSTLFFYFGENHHEMKISNLNSNKEVNWDCTVGPPEWISTSVNFTIESKGNKSILSFAHKGWAKKSRFFEHCNKVWAENISDIKEVAEGGIKKEAA